MSEEEQERTIEASDLNVPEEWLNIDENETYEDPWDIPLNIPHLVERMDILLSCDRDITNLEVMMDESDLTNRVYFKIPNLIEIPDYMKEALEWERKTLEKGWKKPKWADKIDGDLLDGKFDVIFFVGKEENSSDSLHYREDIEDEEYDFFIKGGHYIQKTYKVDGEEKKFTPFSPSHTINSSYFVVTNLEENGYERLTHYTEFNLIIAMGTVKWNFFTDEYYFMLTRDDSDESRYFGNRAKWWEVFQYFLKKDQEVDRMLDSDSPLHDMEVDVDDEDFEEQVPIEMTWQAKEPLDRFLYLDFCKVLGRCIGDRKYEKPDI